MALRVGTRRAAGGAAGIPSYERGVGAVPHALDAARNMPENAQRHQHNQCRDQAVFRHILPLVPMPEKSIDSL